MAAIEIADYHANFTYDDAGWLDQARGWLASAGRPRRGRRPLLDVGGDGAEAEFL